MSFILLSLKRKAKNRRLEIKINNLFPLLPERYGNKIVGRDADVSQIPFRVVSANEALDTFDPVMGWKFAFFPIKNLDPVVILLLDAVDSYFNFDLLLF
jgi:hypothetical protein